MTKPRNLVLLLAAAPLLLSGCSGPEPSEPRTTPSGDQVVGQVEDQVDDTIGDQLDTGGEVSGLAAGACAAPTLMPVDGEVAPGQTITVRGENFFDGCNDTGNGPTPSREDVELTLNQAGAAYALGTVDADDEGVVVFEVAIPDDVEPGKAVLSTDRVARVPVKIAAG